MDTKQIIIVGGGGHAGVLIDLIGVLDKYIIKGIVDPEKKKGDFFLGHPVLGGDEMLSGLFDSGILYAALGVGGVADNSKRAFLYEKLKNESFCLPPLIHPDAVVSASSEIKEGGQVFAGAILQHKCKIGVNSIINTGAIVEHDCCIGKQVHIGPGAVICGGCTVSDNAFVGAGATVIQGVKTGVGSVIAAGSVVIRDVPDGKMVKGVPAQ